MKMKMTGWPSWRWTLCALHTWYDAKTVKRRRRVKDDDVAVAVDVAVDVDVDVDVDANANVFVRWLLTLLRPRFIMVPSSTIE